MPRGTDLEAVAQEDAEKRAGDAAGVRLPGIVKEVPEDNLQEVVAVLEAEPPYAFRLLGWGGAHILFLHRSDF